MQDFTGTKTEANLKAAIKGESRAHASYLHFAAKAKEEGYDAVAHYFETTAVNEQEHAKIWLRFLGGSELDKDAIKADQINVGSSKDNLQAAINGESYENAELYPSFAKAAREEGFEPLAKLFDQVSAIEKSHADHFKTLLERLGSSAVVSAVSKDNWKCDKCGFLTSSKGTPANCPVCNSQGFKLF